jgi:hypothetical protein
VPPRLEKNTSDSSTGSGSIWITFASCSCDNSEPTAERECVCV